MRILLIHPLHEKPGGEERQKKQRIKGIRLVSFPLGLGYIGAVLKNAGHNVQAWDIHGENLLWSEVEEKISSYDFDLVGISAISSQYRYVKQLANLIKRIKPVPIIVGGVLATHSAKLVLERCNVDFCVIGEGELTTVELIEKLDKPNTVKGIAYKDALGNVIFTTPRPYIKDLSILPLPAYELFDMNFYISHSTKMGTKSLNGETAFKKVRNLRAGYVIAGRGCPYRCAFCSRNYKGVRIRPIWHIMKEIEFLKEKYNVQYIHFGDELLTINKNTALQLCEEMKKTGLLWDCQSRVNLVDEEILTAMKNSGCVTVGFGIESGSQRLLNAMNKMITVEQIERAMKTAMKVGIDVKVQLMFGFPGENMESLQETIELFKRLNHPGRRMSFFTVLPGTKIYERCIADGTIPDEEKYLCELAEGGGWGKVLLNFTEFKNEEIMPRMKWARYMMMANASNNDAMRNKWLNKAEKALKIGKLRMKKRKEKLNYKKTLKNIIKKFKGYIKVKV